MNPQNTQALPPENTDENPVSHGKQIMAIEKSLKEEISAIQEILAMVIQNKVDLDKIKEMTKGKLQSMLNE